MKASITIDIDTNDLSRWNDRHLAAMWHVAQANPADCFEDPAPGQLAEAIGREIIRRFLTNTPPEVYSHQGHHYFWHRAFMEKSAQEPSLRRATLLGECADALEALAADTDDPAAKMAERIRREIDGKGGAS